MNSDIQDQVILARAKLWTPELDKLLRKWKKNIGKREKGHLDLARTYTKRHYIFGVPATVLSAIIASGIFATFRNCSDCDNQNNENCWIDQWIRLVVGIISLISTALTAFVTFMNYQESAEENKTAADKYTSLYNDLDTMLLIPGPVRGDPVNTLQTIRRRYDDIVTSSPTLPSKYNVELSYEYSPSIAKSPPKPEDVVIPSLRKMSVQTNNNGSIDTDALREMMDVSVEIDKNLNQENDVDTSDEENEVKIAIDLDGQPSYTEKDTNRAMAINSIIKENTINNHSHSLQFEMDRLNDLNSEDTISSDRSSENKNNDF